MKPEIQIDKNTNVAFLDAAEPAPNAIIRTFSVSDQLGLRSQLLARVDVENNVLLGLVIEDYRSFRKEIRIKYVAWRIERIIELLLCSVNGIVCKEVSHGHRLAPV